MGNIAEVWVNFMLTLSIQGLEDSETFKLKTESGMT